ncbi:VanZ family protein [Kribbella sp. WER1]
MLPAVLAVVGGVALAFVLLTPFVYRTYRRRGELGFGALLLAFSSLVYGLAVVAYVLFPVPTIDDAWCAAHKALTHPQLNPFQFLDDIAKERARGAGGLLVNPAVQQTVFNVFLFIPFGAYLRHYTRRNPVLIVLAGFGVSLLIETTQLTGNWFLFDCPYRLFDVDDLLTNTFGTAVGLLLAPALRLIDRRTPGATVDEPRPVTTRRRWLGMIIDLVSVTVLGGAFGVLANLITVTVSGHWLYQSGGGRFVQVVLTTWLPAVLLLAVPALSKRQATIGQLSVRLRRVAPDGGRPGRRMVVALAAGCFGYFVLSGLATYVESFDGLAGLLQFGAFVCAWRPKTHPGMSGLVSGLQIVDDRQSADLPVDV